MEKRKIVHLPAYQKKKRVHPTQRRKLRPAAKVLLRIPVPLYEWLKGWCHTIGTNMTAFINYLLVLERAKNNRKEIPHD